ncbi:MAG: hypothetical protein ACYC3X_25415 [Pirellulaceae bacterium]
MWQFESLPDVAKRLKKLEKHHSDEVAQVYSNLDTYISALEQGINPLQLVREFRFVRNEGMGVYAIDQSPLGRGYAEIRLYLFPDIESEWAYLLTIGDKDQQRRGDVKDCHDIVRRIRKS